MACASRSVISVAANTCSSSNNSSSSFSFKTCHLSAKFGRLDTSKFRIRASSDEAEDCNVEECAPDKEVGTVSMEWLAGEKTKVAGTFPPRKKVWSGYVEKDTAGQTNIYSVEPSVYVAESVISSGNAGSSSDGAENTAAIAAGLALISVAAASSILLQVGKNAPPVPTVYSGPALSYYVTKFQASESTPVSIPSQSESPPVTESQISTPEAPEVAVETTDQQEPSTSTVDNAS